MTATRIRHVTRVNPPTPAFVRLADDAPVTFLPMEAVWSDGRLDLSQRREKGQVATGYTRFQSGDVLVPKITPTFEAGRSILTPTLTTGVGAGTTELHVLRPSPDIAGRYLAYIVNSVPFLRLGEAEMYGVAGQKRVPDEFVRDFVVDLPDLGEQQRIADFLDAETTRIDTLVGLVERALKLLEAKRNLHVLNVVEPTVDGAPRPTMPLKYLSSSISVGIVITPARWYVEGDGVTALRGLNIRPGVINVDDIVRLSHEGHALHAKSTLRGGDVVVVRTGQTGVAAVVPSSLHGSNCIDLVIVRPMTTVVPEYLELVLNSEYAQQFINESSVGTIQSHLNVSALKQLPIPKRDVGEQTTVVTAVRQIESEIRTVSGLMKRQVQLLAERRQALITAAVTGQFDVTTARGVDLS